MISKAPPDDFRARAHATGVMAGLVSILVAAVLTAFSVSAVPLSAQDSFTEVRSTLPDGTLYVMRVPTNWNGTLIRDLDYAGRADNPLGLYLLDQGYALAGTQRHRLRAFQYDPAREIANLNSVLDIFGQRFRAPDRVIQYGCSGGGHVTLGVAEDFSDRVDGAIALGAHTPVWLMNTFLDGWFTLQTLIAPDLPIVDLPFESSGGTAHGVEGEIPEQWRRAVSAAQQTPEGRARIALASAIGQWPVWSGNWVPLPDLGDAQELQHSIYHITFDRYSNNPGGEARIMFESAANGQQLSWNTGVDYREFFENGNDALKRAVRELYAEAGADLDTDLARINAAERVEASEHALDFWDAPGRNVVGDPKIPLLRMHEIGDYQVPMSLVQGYNRLIEANGKQNLYRAAYVESPTHCGFNVAESAAAIETMMSRLDTGKWGSTQPHDLNELASSLGANATPRFIDPEPYFVDQYNRVWNP